MNNNRRTNRVLMPINNQNNHTPEGILKYPSRQYTQIAMQPYTNPQLKQFVQSPDYLAKKSKTDEYLLHFSIKEINQQLDRNLDDIISLLSKRKTLMAMKKKKILDQAQQQLIKAKNSGQFSQNEYSNEQEFIKIVNFCQNPKTAVKMLGKIIKTIPQIKGPRIDEQQRSQQFWGRNRKLQNDIDIILQKLKSIDKQLQKQNGQVLQICRELDRIQDTLKSFVGAKSQDHVSKVEPLFNSKKKNYDILNRKIKQRQISKDKKIQYIKKIKNILEELKRTREERLGEIASFFGIESSWQFDKMNLKEQGDFGNGLQELLKIKQRDNQLEISQKQVLAQLDILDKDQQKIYNQLLKRLSDQAKAFHNFNNIQQQRLKYNSILSLFQYQSDNFDFSSIQPKEYLKKFKQVKNFFKRFLQEDTLLKQGLVKTSQTTKTFVNLLRATQNQKQRRHELLGLLQACIKKRGQYELKRQQFRNIQFQESRNQQELSQHEQDLQGVLTDGDLQGYRRIGSAIDRCQNEKQRLNQVKQMIDKQMQSMDRDVLSIANRIQQQYEDILSDILPSDYQYSLKTGEDVKKLRNQLRKMYKRLGLLNSQ